MRSTVWDIYEIKGLSVIGYYYEVTPILSELIDNMPKSCLHLFNIFSLTTNKKNWTVLLKLLGLNSRFEKMVVYKILNETMLIKMP